MSQDATNEGKSHQSAFQLESLASASSSLAASLAETDMLSAVAAGQFSTPIYCPVNGRWYSLRVRKDNYSDAVIIANNSFHMGRRGRLGVINRVDVLQWLNATYGPLRPGYVYIGGVLSGRTWIWYPTGGRVEMSGRFWQAGQPDYYRNNENRIAMNFNAGGYFADVSANGRYYYLVEY